MNDIHYIQNTLKEENAQNKKSKNNNQILTHKVTHRQNSQHSKIQIAMIQRDAATIQFYLKSKQQSSKENQDVSKALRNQDKNLRLCVKNEVSKACQNAEAILEKDNSKVIKHVKSKLASYVSSPVQHVKLDSS